MSAIALTPQRDEKTYSTMSSSSSSSTSSSMTTEDRKEPKKEGWDFRTKVAVYGQGFLFLVAWMVALGRLISGRFWNKQLNTENVENLIESDKTPEGIVQFLKYFFLSYYNKRFIVFFPHIVGAILWWNLYFLQLIPSIRRKHKRFHRILGRVLMVSAMAQTISGVGLAYMGNSPTVKLVSYLLAVAVVYCVYNAWYFASIKDIPKHKYWAMRLVGYLQTIALQRVFMGILFAAHATNSLGLYPPYDKTDGDTLIQAFDDSFVCSLVVAILLTEWYLAGYYGWTETEKKV